MSRTIWKYEIEITDSQTISLPSQHKIIHFGLDPNQVPCIWAEVNPTNSVVNVEIRLVGTGHPIDFNHFSYLGSFNQSVFVWHIYVPGLDLV